MNSHSWLRYFEANRQNFITPDWNAPVPLTNELRTLLARSLSHFQLGESGGGRHLFGKAAQQRRRTPPIVRPSNYSSRKKWNMRGSSPAWCSALAAQLSVAIGRTFFSAARVAPSD
ncbi:MAG TPA: hypothetical protein VGL24_01710 [Chthoniobacterales bacterium]